MKVKITSDHGGHLAKIELAKRLQAKGYEVELRGSENSETSVSYSEIGINFAKEIIADNDFQNNRYVAFCGSGIGISIALNRFKKIRCARVANVQEAKLAKLHNNANVLCMGGRLLTSDEIEAIFNEWEKTQFEGNRHIPRINKLDEVGE
ncbi:RpiB/LacA/LacB family sugar-phosphate isomerase [Metamycoplasma equirhinis]|uniref:RpiB/LacA/LacB family sugar-phosphate isomerase n=1 Tax=Metamycoplasma equirhinis TaxID=92402 RepID=A0ABZ0PA02_9BACT|nr:RpiB/LacA/LacB family sugar-phosphate isomerase [Metamycoplasma equirhinis]TPD99399.1 RpiB/LacA/LacB family sugar-phosphate isomerase [Metamycoplasma equirhinis]WPB53857.1 RpiB/LacA/LacB family sugar-phosphate isomerase [Metamycoplasma equirhinis]BDX52897.1 ribose 5-phosphate isomerase B [Metamycoplasma equirhinis]